MHELSIENLSIRQVKAARALLGWSQHDLAKASGISYPTIARLENGEGQIGGRTSTIDAIRSTLKVAGVIFISENGHGEGVRLMKTREKKYDSQTSDK